MSGVNVQYNINTKELLTVLERLHNFQTSGLFDEIGAYVTSETTRRFKEGVDWQGNPFEPSQRAKKDNGKTLVDRGHLRDSITHNVFIDGSGVEIGSDLPYAAIHQFGGLAGKRHNIEIKARPYMGINNADEQEIDDIIHAHMRKVLN